MGVKIVPKLNCQCGGKLSLSKYVISDEVKLCEVYDLTPDEIELKLSNVKKTVKYVLKCSICFYPEPELAGRKLIDVLKEKGFDIVGGSQ